MIKKTPSEIITIGETVLRMPPLTEKEKLIIERKLLEDPKLRKKFLKEGWVWKPSTILGPIYAVKPVKVRSYKRKKPKRLWRKR